LNRPDFYANRLAADIRSGGGKMSREEESNNRLDRLLRRWGAEEAAGQADVSHLEAPIPLRAPRPSVFWRWMPVAASLVLLAGTAAVLYINHAHGPLARHEQAPPASDELTRLRAERNELAASGRELRGALTETQERLQTTEDNLQQAVERVAEQSKEDGEIRKQIADLSRAMAAKQDDLTRMADLLKEREERISAGLAEIAELRRSVDAFSAERRDVADRLAALRAEHFAELAMLRRFYFEAAAPGVEGIRARQLAARKNLLLLRCGRLHPEVRSQTTEELFDVLEVMLTRLDLLNPADQDAVESFLALVRRTVPAGRIQTALEEGEEDAAVCEWLVETELVLTGV